MRRHLLALFLFFGILLIVWIPFGFQNTGLIEEWTIFKSFNQPSSLNVDYINVQPTRLLVMPLFHLGYLLTPHSFFGLNWLMFGLFLLKGATVYTILRRLFPNGMWIALITSIVFILYPANEAGLLLRIYHYHVAILFYLLAVYGFVLYWQTRRLWQLIFMGVCLLISLAILEISYPLVLLTPLLLLVNRHQWKSVFRLALLWYLVPIAWGVYVIFLAFHGGLDYQEHLVTEAHTNTNQLLVYGFYILRAYKYTLIDAWHNALVQIPSPYWLGGLIAGCLATGVSHFFTNRQSLSIRQEIKLIVAGLGIIVFGFALYLPTPHRSSNDYVFLLASVGAALSTTVAVSVIFHSPRIKSILLPLAGGVLVGLSTLAMLNQQAKITHWSQKEMQVLNGIRQQVPSPQAKTFILVFDHSDLNTNNWGFGLPFTNEHFTDAARYSYNSPDVDVFMCYPGMSYLNTCALYGDAVYISSAVIPENVISYKRVIALDITSSGEVNLLDRIPAEYLKGGTAQGYDPRSLLSAASTDDAPK